MSFKNTVSILLLLCFLKKIHLIIGKIINNQRKVFNKIWNRLKIFFLLRTNRVLVNKKSTKGKKLIHNFREYYDIKLEKINQVSMEKFIAIIIIAIFIII